MVQKQKQYINYDSNANNINNNNNNINNNSNKDINCNLRKLLDIICGVPLGAILGSLLFILSIYNLSQSLKPIMFADDTNSFCSIKEIKPLFLKVNLELGKISEWFQADKLSLNEGKTTVTLFHMPQDRDNLPLRLPALKIND